MVLWKIEQNNDASVEIMGQAMSHEDTMLVAYYPQGWGSGPEGRPCGKMVFNTR